MNPTIISPEQMVTSLLFLAGCGLVVLLMIGIAYIAVQLLGGYPGDSRKLSNQPFRQYEFLDFSKNKENKEKDIE
jgi:hypothetical protein